jgi:arginase
VEREAIARHDIAGATTGEVARDPEATAHRAVEHARRAAPRRLVHFDVDVVDFVDMPLSENTGRNSGLRFDTAMTALDVLLAGGDLAGVTISELNPHHGAEDGATLTAFVGRLAAALAHAVRA